MTRDKMLDDLEVMWRQRDPVPDGLVDRMRALAGAEVALADTDLDYELMLLIERSTELAGTRSTATAYTLRFASPDLDLLVRAGGGASEAGLTRLDGWIVPPAPVTVRATKIDQDQVGGAEERSWEVDVDDQGRFEFPELPPGLYRLWLSPRDDDDKAFGTPAFEI
jgi:hypothetical protein